MVRPSIIGELREMEKVISTQKQSSRNFSTSPTSNFKMSKRLESYPNFSFSLTYGAKVAAGEKRIIVSFKR